MNRLDEAKIRVNLQAEDMKAQIGDWPLRLYVEVADKIDIWVEHKHEELEAEAEERG